MMNRPRLRAEHARLLTQMESILVELNNEEPRHAPRPPLGPEALAQALLTEARRRAQVFGDLDFHDPQWLMLLDLFVADWQRREICVSSLCIASGVPSTTALRHMAFLETRGMLSKHPHPRDSRRSIVTLTEEGRERIMGYLLSTEQVLTAVRRWG